jgi:hypothetical protein
VIGGVPTRSISELLAVPVGWAGLARGIAANHLASANIDIPRQSLDCWATVATRTLADWTSEMLDGALKRAMPSPGLNSAEYEVYAPHLHPSQGQINRWVPAKSWRSADAPSAMGLALCRTRSRPRRFWLATLIGNPHGTTYGREAPVPPDSVRRLMYGIDQLTGATVFARILPVVSGVRQEREVRLFNWPARKEYQLLAALAFDMTQPEGPFLPIRYRVSPEWWHDVRMAVEGLSIRIKDETGLDT